MSDKFVTEEPVWIISDCQTCANRSTKVSSLCLAFPNGIPMDILLGKVSHHIPYPGDDGIMWEPKT